MKNIKFRYWDKERNRMDSVSKLNWNEGELQIWIFKSYNYGWYPAADYVLMQFIGLRDKNGIEIYEGDIVDSEDEINGEATMGRKMIREVVEWYPENTCFGVNGYMQITRDQARKMDVMGNIYEDSRLLNDGMYDDEKFNLNGI